VTYVDDVLPILRSSCRGCHTAGSEPCPEGIVLGAGGAGCPPTYSLFAASYAETQLPSTKCSGVVVGVCLGFAVEDQELMVEKHCRTSTVRTFHREEWRCLTEEERAVIAAWISGGMVEQ
jgi:hypothetical protein